MKLSPKLALVEIQITVVSILDGSSKLNVVKSNRQQKRKIFLAPRSEKNVIRAAFCLPEGIRGKESNISGYVDTSDAGMWNNQLDEGNIFIQLIE